MKKDLDKILLVLRHIEENQNRENREDRLKSLDRENELLRGYIERIEDKLKALERHLEIEYVKEANYKSKK